MRVVEWWRANLTKDKHLLDDGMTNEVRPPMQSALRDQCTERCQTSGPIAIGCPEVALTTAHAASFKGSCFGLVQVQSKNK